MDFFDQIMDVFSLMQSDQRLQMLGVVVVYASMSIITLVMYGLDKTAARNRKPRISERTLLFCGLACGWPGAVLAQKLFRHKTIKPSFRLAFVSTVIFNCFALAVLFYWSSISLNLLR
ncbi:DUF1294 domain-containing protein [Undibacterium sp. Ji42W]|uniref:DUF1294 domain-containing protein n=1 Tax=Undibacterium sp. Ji42W TaxID=3413039 RepID=UPI003BF17076